MNPRYHCRPLALTIACLLAIAASACAQYGSGGQNPQQGTPKIQRGGQNSPLNGDPLVLGASHTPGAAQEHMAIARNEERQKRLAMDTERLVTLVTQLKADVDKADKYMLSLDVVRRSEEIEKLARSIKEREKN
jgi:hypothetical protein